MYLEKPHLFATDEMYDLICLLNDGALDLIALYVEPVLVHHTNNKCEKQA